MLKADFHVHTLYSFDSSTSLEDVIERCRQRGITCVNIADHATAEGGLKLQKMAPFRVIVSEEVLTPYGEIMGMFLKESIPSPLSVEDALARIKDQGGLVCIPHPFDRLRGSALRTDIVKRIMPQVDVVEGFNARNVLPRANERARKLAAQFGKPVTAGSDAHTPREIGNAWVEMPEFTSSGDFLQALAQGKIVGRLSNPAVHFASTWSKLVKRKPEE